MMKRIFPIVVFLSILTPLLYCQKSINDEILSYAKGERYKYNSKGHEKSKGLEIQIEIPNDWIKKEGERPHIIQKFSSSGKILGTVYT